MTTGRIFYIGLCENSINQISIYKSLNMQYNPDSDRREMKIIIEIVQIGDFERHKLVKTIFYKSVAPSHRFRFVPRDSEPHGIRS